VCGVCEGMYGCVCVRVCMGECSVCDCDGVYGCVCGSGCKRGDSKMLSRSMKQRSA